MSWHAIAFALLVGAVFLSALGLAGDWSGWSDHDLLTITRAAILLAYGSLLCHLIGNRP